MNKLSQFLFSVPVLKSQSKLNKQYEAFVIIGPMRTLSILATFLQLSVFKIIYHMPIRIATFYFLFFLNKISFKSTLNDFSDKETKGTH